MVYPDPPERVWQALTDPASLADWLMPNDFRAVVGHQFQFKVAPTRAWNGIVDCTVLVVEPARRLSYSWRNARAGIDTVVTWTLAPHEGGTRLVLAHTGFRGARGIAVSVLLGRGWRSRVLTRRLPATLVRLRRPDN